MSGRRTGALQAKKQVLGVEHSMALEIKPRAALMKQ